MKISVEDISPIQKRLSVEIPPDVVTREIDRAYSTLKSTVSIKGFRKGKVPFSMLERYYGPQVEEDVLKSLLDKTLAKAIEEANVELILQPVLDSQSPVQKNEGFTYSLLLDLWPEFQLPDYKGLEIERPELQIADEEITEQLEALRRHFGSIADLDEDRPLKDGDVAIINFDAIIEGEKDKNFSQENYYLEVGRGQLYEQFDQALPGMEKDTEKEISVTFPKDAVNAKVAGKTVEFKVYLKDIKKRELPELNDDFAKKFGENYNTIEDLKNRIRDQIKKDKEEAVERDLISQILKKLYESVEFPIPERLVQGKLTQMLDNISWHLQEKGFSLETAGLSEEKLKEKMREDAIFQAKTEIILDKIAETENIAIDEDETSRYIQGQGASTEVDKKELAEAVKLHVMPKLRAKKTLDFLLDQAAIKTAGQES